MTMGPEELRELGESSTNVSSPWAGATDYLSRGLKEWVRCGRQRSPDRRGRRTRLVRARGRPLQADQTGLPPKSYIEHMLASIRRWLDEPSRENTERVRSSLDVTRSAHAWQRDQDVAPFWILDAVDHASLRVVGRARLVHRPDGLWHLRGAFDRVACYTRAARCRDGRVRACSAVVAAVQSCVR